MRFRPRALYAVAGLVALVASGIALRHFDRRPLDLSSWAFPDRRVAPEEPARGTMPGALVVVSSDAVRRARGEDASFAWLDVLENEYGAVRWLEPADLVADREEVSVAVVTSSAQPLVAEATLAALAARALVVVVDRAPDATRTDGVRARVRRVGAASILETTGLADRIARRRQGLLGENQTITKRFGSYPDVREPEDLLSDASSLASEVPEADRWIADLAAEIDALVPIPRLWPYPAGSLGAFLLTHDEDLQGGAAMLDLLRREAEWNVRATVFVIPSGRLWDTWSDEDLAEARRLGADLQLHWNRLPMPAGIWKIEPYRTVYRLSTQLQGLRRRGVRATINRTHYLELGPDLADTFRTLAAAGIEADASFGPNRVGRGYLFGTGRPFRVLDRTGLPSPVLEIPFQTQEDWGGVDVGFVERLFRGSASQDHATISAIIHPHLIVRTPEGERLLRRFVDAAREMRHWTATCSEYLEFRRSRLSSPIRLSRVQDQRGVVADLTLERSDFAIAVPSGSCKLDGRPVAGETVRGGRLMLVSIPAGRHRIEIEVP